MFPFSFTPFSANVKVVNEKKNTAKSSIITETIIGIGATVKHIAVSSLEVCETKVNAVNILLNSISCENNSHSDIMLRCIFLHKLISKNTSSILSYVGKIQSYDLAIIDESHADVVIGKIQPSYVKSVSYATIDACVGKTQKYLFSGSENTITKVVADNIVFISELFEIKMKPGDELRLDCENYTITLNGENVLSLYEGDFFEISRETIRCQLVPTDDGIVNGYLVFTESYLW